MNALKSKARNPDDLAALLKPEVEAGHFNAHMPIRSPKGSNKPSYMSVLGIGQANARALKSTLTHATAIC